MASFPSRLKEADIPIAPLLDHARVDAASWKTACSELSGKEDGISLVSDLGFLNPRDVAVFLEASNLRAVPKARIGLLFDMCREHCGLPAVMKTSPTSPASSGAEPGDTAVASKRLRLATFLDEADEGFFDLLSPATYSERVSEFVSVYGNINSEWLPTREQLSALRSRLLDNDIPYCDFKVWQTNQRHRLREARQSAWVVNADGEFKKVSQPGLPSYEAWRDSFRVFKFGMLVLKEGSLANYEVYSSTIQRLHDTFPMHWGLVYRADDLLRSSKLVSYKRPNCSWGTALALAAEDAAFWREHVDLCVLRILAAGGPPAQSSGGASNVSNNNVGNNNNSGNGNGPAAAKDAASRGARRRRREVCYAYQTGACPVPDGTPCPNGRKHVCLGCRGSHSLPRGELGCTKATAPAPAAQGVSGNQQPPGAASSRSGMAPLKPQAPARN